MISRYLHVSSFHISDTITTCLCGSNRILAFRDAAGDGIWRWLVAGAASRVASDEHIIATGDVCRSRRGELLRSLLPLLVSCNRFPHLRQLHALLLTTGLARAPFHASKLLAAAATLHLPYACSIFARTPTPSLFNFNTILRAHSISTAPNVGEIVFLFNSIRAGTLRPDQFSFITVLKGCARARAVHPGMMIHGCVVRSGFHVSLKLRNTLIAFYCSCGVIQPAQRLFDEMGMRRDAVSFGALMGGYIQDSRHAEVVKLFVDMKREGLETTPTAVIHSMAASCNLDRGGAGKILHGHCIKTGFCFDKNVATSAIHMHLKQGHMDSAMYIFEQMPTRDVVTWNCMIDGYAKCGLLEESFALLKQMTDGGMKPNTATLAGLLSVCSSSAAFLMGEHIHRYIEEEGLKLDTILGTALIDMYSKSGRIDIAVQVFDKMPAGDVVAWTAMIAGYGINGNAAAALGLFHEMEKKGVRPNGVTFLALLNACSHAGWVVSGKQCLERMVRGYGMLPNVEHYGCVIDLLGRAGLLEEAFDLIQSLSSQMDAAAWRALLSACRIHGNIEMGEAAQKHLTALGDLHPTDLILLSNTFTVSGKPMDGPISTNPHVTKMKKEAGCSSIEMTG